jgi:hypothetical protein
VEGKMVANVTNAFNFDPSTGELFIDIGDRIEIYGPKGDFRGEVAKGIKNSGGVAVGPNHHVYVLNEAKIIELGYVVHPDIPIDNPAVIHAVRQAGVRDSSDIQVDPAGHYAAFGSAVPTNGFDPFGHLQVYRYDAQADSIACASCAQGNSETTKDSSLPAHGNGLTTDGRVFFNSSEPLVLRDTNGNEDPYEWSSGRIYLLSSGTSPDSSGMLSASASGKDAFFFTRDTLAPEDQNGALMKLYDAREDGGFFHIPDPPPCAASDECHGPGTIAAPTPSARSLNGANGNASRCKRGFSKKRGKCSRVHRKRHPKRHAKRNGVGR